MNTDRKRWDCICDRIRDIPNPVGAEIGVHRGECSANLLRLHKGLYLYMIDSWAPDTYKGHESGATKEYREMYEKQWENNRRLAYEAVNNYKNRFSFIQENSVNAAAQIDNHKLDFVFIDAAHDYDSVKADIEAWLPKIKPGGWIMFHDYGNPNFPGVKSAVCVIFGEQLDDGYGLRTSMIERDDDYFAAVAL